MPFVLALVLSIATLIGPIIVTGRFEWLMATLALAPIVLFISLVAFTPTK